MNELIKIENNKITIDSTFAAIKDIEKRILEFKIEEESVASARRSLEFAVAGAKETIKKYMQDNGLCEISGDLVKYSLHKGNPSLNIEDESKIPTVYKEETITTKIRKDAIKDQLKMGDIIEGCSLSDTWVLKIGVNK